MPTLYDIIFELKQDLTDKTQLNIEISDEKGSIIRTGDKISCIDNILIIVREDIYCLIPLDKIIRVRTERRII